MGLGHRILITGGSGFLGRGIMRQLHDNEFTVYSRDEYKQDLCRQKFPNARYIIGDVRDVDRLTLAMYDADTVIHAAAMKYIPEAEANVGECININVNGSHAVLQAARAAGVQKVIGISTDKACMPVNTYGITKALMERIFDEQSRYINCSCVRYGNVIGSTGSVIPVFERQLREKGFVTVTGPYMTRYWISIDDAVKLILLALDASPGEIVIPMPSAMTTGDLAKSLAGDKIEIIGLRPGEKAHENLLHSQESVRAVKAGNHYILKPTGTIGDNEQFTLVSSDPRHWLTPEELHAVMADAKCV